MSPASPSANAGERAPVLEVNNLTKHFGGVRAVSDVSFSVFSGERVALIGPNGAGKTTCFNMVMGQIRSDSGSVRLAGRDLTPMAPRQIWRLGVGRTFQITATFASMSVLENIQMAFVSHHRRLSAVIPTLDRLYRDAAIDLLARVGIGDQAERMCGVLAYGDLKRVELAIALANEPALLLMDEPTAGMAPKERIALMALTSEIARERGTSVLFTEHDMDVVFAHADRILVMNRGELIAQGFPQAVRENRRVQEVYLGTGATYRKADVSLGGAQP
jgi:branched-chain amino acid transport system ATP-binding protein